MNDRTMIKVRCDKELLYIRTISWQKKSPHRFAILRSELQKLEQEPNKRVLTSDCGSFASLRLTKGPDGTQILEIRFTWLQEDGNDKVHGWKEDVRIVPFPVSWTVKMKKKQKETQDILSYHSQAAGCSDKARAKASGGRQPIEECGRTGL